MPKVLRTSVRPYLPVTHECRDARGARVQAEALSNTLCRQCDTQIVYVWSNAPANPQPKGNRVR